MERPTPLWGCHGAGLRRPSADIPQSGPGSYTRGRTGHRGAPGTLGTRRLSPSPPTEASTSSCHLLSCAPPPRSALHKGLWSVSSLSPSYRGGSLGPRRLPHDQVHQPRGSSPRSFGSQSHGGSGRVSPTQGTGRHSPSLRPTPRGQRAAHGPLCLPGPREPVEDGQVSLGQTGPGATPCPGSAEAAAWTRCQGLRLLRDLKQRLQGEGAVLVFTWVTVKKESPRHIY